MNGVIASPELGEWSEESGLLDIHLSYVLSFWSCNDLLEDDAIDDKYPDLTQMDECGIVWLHEPDGMGKDAIGFIVDLVFFLDPFDELDDGPFRVHGEYMVTVTAEFPLENEFVLVFENSLHKLRGWGYHF